MSFAGVAVFPTFDEAIPIDESESRDRQGPAIRLRPANRDEAGVVAALQRRVRDDFWELDVWRRELARPQTIVWLAESETEGRPVAFLAMWRVLDRLEIVDIVVEPPFRRSGIATSMLEAAIGIGGARGVRQIVLEVRSENRPAKRLYEELGFEWLDGPGGEEGGDGDSVRRMVLSIGDQIVDF